MHIIVNSLKRKKMKNDITVTLKNAIVNKEIYNENKNVQWKVIVFSNSVLWEQLSMILENI